MSLGVRSKLFLISVTLILSGVSMGGIILQSELRAYLENRIESELTHQAAAVREAIILARTPATLDAMNPLADVMGLALGNRVTVIGPDGRVLGDSQVDIDGLPRVELHGQRPEVIAALKHDRGMARRHSTTVEQEMLYVALPFEHPQGRGVVRVARPLAEIDAAQARLRMLVFAAGLVAVLIAVIMSGLASHLLSRPLRQLVQSARALASGDRTRIDVESTDELGGLAGSLNHMAADVAATMSALATERARFEAVLDSMAEAVIALDAERRITLMNPRALALFGLDDAPLGKPFIEHLRAPAIHELLIEPIEAESCEFELPGSPLRRVLGRVSPQRHGGCVIVMHDVTAIRRLETVRRDFVANVSHELRTPVSIIRANAETLQGGAMNHPVHGARILDALHRNAERLARIVEDLLDLSRLEAGRYQINREGVKVAEAAQKAIAAIERTATEKGISVGCEVPDELLARADDKALDQILVNYLDNAIKYTPAGGEVRVLAREHGSRVRIEVIDNGPGIAPRHRERIFERFYRIDPGRSRDMGGTGLGLSIVKHLADAMNGDAGMEPVAPRGSCFWISLPQA